MKGELILKNDGYIDLHIHSNVSDGKMSVESIMELARTNNMRTIAFSEHYNMGSYNLAKILAADDIEVIPAVEIGASLSSFGISKKHVCHVIAYYPSYMICNILDEYEKSRETCVKKTLKKLQKSIPLSYRDVVKYARNKSSIGRFDIAVALYKKGYAKSPVAAYGQFLELGKVCYVEREKIDIVDLIKRIRKINGVPIIAHPKSMKLNFDDTFNLLYKLKECGLEGLEVYNPCNTIAQREEFLMLCRYFDLLPTCGSDFHGMQGRLVNIGTGINNNLCISDYSIIQDLKRRQNAIFCENHNKKGCKE